MAARDTPPRSIRMIAFSPVGVEACFAQLHSYTLHQQLSSHKDADDAPGLTPAEQKRMQLARKLPVGVVVAAAGGVRDRDNLQAVLDAAGVGVRIPDSLEPDSTVGVSSVRYSFAWPSEMCWTGSAQSVPSGAFKLVGNKECFLARVFAPQRKFDALVVYVDHADEYDISVMLVGMPDDLPSALTRAKDNDELMAVLAALLRDIIAKRVVVRNPPPLGTATLFDLDAASAFDLRTMRGRKLPGGATVDYAQHVCRLFMNKDGGGVRAGTLMISKGMSMYEETPVDLDFRAFRNGYLVCVEMTRPSVADLDPVALVVGWANVPAGVTIAN